MCVDESYFIIYVYWAVIILVISVLVKHGSLNVCTKERTISHQYQS